MNYLAHAYLSFNDPAILAGNLISDFVKGKKKLEYATGIQKGIALHRAIDIFTDTHEATRDAKEIFRPQYRLYSGAFVDVVYDHFLAIDKTAFKNNGLLLFSNEVYAQIEPQLAGLPEYFQMIFPYMKTQNWLYNYQYKWGIERSFAGLVRRAVYLKESKIAFELFNTHYDYLQSCYQLFFPEVFTFAREYIL